MNRSHTRLQLQLHRLGLATVGALVVLGVAAGPAAAHAEVTASDPRALAENVTLSFTSEAESDSAGIAELRVVLPTGIAPDAVTLKDAPKEWKLTATPDGYAIGGPALATGTDAEYSITVRQLPDEKSLAFKTLETYSDGKISRWIEVPTSGEKVDNPAPVLALKAAAPGAKLIAPSTSPSPTPSTAPAKSVVRWSGRLRTLLPALGGLHRDLVPVQHRRSGQQEGLGPRPLRLGRCPLCAVGGPLRCGDRNEQVRPSLGKDPTGGLIWLCAADQ
ncbi:DUF1775 domain-containing protein [Streptomyces nojiriensis]|uniref:DUF1775 domain-containing protein n=1 Tax=Streptomyces nojiriensis TaxID=66374 RepID=UPI0036DDEA58